MHVFLFLNNHKVIWLCLCKKYLVRILLIKRILLIITRKWYLFDRRNVIRQLISIVSTNLEWQH